MPALSGVRAPSSPLPTTAGDTDTGYEWRRLGSRLLAWAPAMVFVVFLTAAVRAGIPALEAIRGLLVVLITQLLPGILLWRVVRPLRGWWAEDVAVGFALGVGFAVVGQTIAGTLQVPWFAALPGPLIAAALLGIPATRRGMLAARVEPLPLAWGPAVAAITLLQLLSVQAFYRETPLSWQGGFRDVYVDLPFHLALAGELANRGPSAMPHVAGEALDYHWFSHAWVAQIGALGSIELDATFFRLMPPIMAVVATLAVATAAVRISNRAWAGPLAALLAVAAGDLDLLGGVRAPTFVSLLSPSLSLSIPLLAGLVGLLVARWRRTARTGGLPVLIGLAIVAGGTKGSTLPVLLGGVALALAAAVFLRQRVWRRILSDFAVLAACLLAGYVAVFGGGPAGSLRFAPAQAVAAAGIGRDVASGTRAGGVMVSALVGAVVLISVLARGAGLLGLLKSRAHRHDPVTWLLLGTGMAGAAAVVLLAHDGNSQWYFLRSAAPVLVIGAAAGLLELLDRVDDKVSVLATGLLVGVIGVGVPSGLLGLSSEAGLGSALGSLLTFAGVVAAGVAMRRLRPQAVVLGVVAVAVTAACVVPVVIVAVTRALPPYAARVEPTEPVAFSNDQVRAARWLRDNSDADDVVMTNRHCTSPMDDPCDSRRFHVAAYTERSVLVEGWSYTPTWWQSELPKKMRPFWDERLLRLNDDFLSDPTAAGARRLRELGVDWIFIDKTAPYGSDLDAFATLRLTTPWAQVYKMPT